MRIGSVNGTNTGVQAMNRMAQGNDSVSKHIQSQIQNLQEKMQKLSEDEEMTIEEKMKKRQEIQQEIANLNSQLRQHQIEQRKKQQESKNYSIDDMVGGKQRTASKANGGQSAGLSQASMKAMISADSSMKQAAVQGSVVTRMEGRAGVLESEIKMDKVRGGSTETKEAELAEVQAKAAEATASQMNTLGDANAAMEEAREADMNNKSDNKVDNDKKADEKDADKTVQKGDDQGEIVNTDSTAKVEVSEPVQVTTTTTTTNTTSLPKDYTHVDVLI